MIICELVIEDGRTFFGSEVVIGLAESKRKSDVIIAKYRGSDLDDMVDRVFY